MRIEVLCQALNTYRILGSKPREPLTLCLHFTQSKGPTLIVLAVGSPPLYFPILGLISSPSNCSWKNHLEKNVSALKFFSP